MSEHGDEFVYLMLESGKDGGEITRWSSLPNDALLAAWEIDGTTLEGGAPRSVHGRPLIIGARDEVRLKRRKPVRGVAKSSSKTHAVPRFSYERAELQPRKRFDR